MIPLFSSSLRRVIVIKAINSLLAGFLVLLGAISTGNLTTRGIVLAIAASGGAAIAQFKEFWDQLDRQICTDPVKISSFIL
jgi:hypothetical protein